MSHFDASPSQTAAIALGANLGDRHAALRFAFDRLANAPGVAELVEGPIIETPPVGPGPQPDYLNSAALVSTSLPPRDVLDVLLMIEQEAGRDRANEQRWAARTLDLDLILYGDLIVNEPGLTVPHPRMHERRFVLEPLAAIAPDMLHPLTGLSVAAMLAELASRELADPQAGGPPQPRVRACRPNCGDGASCGHETGERP